MSPGRTRRAKQGNGCKLTSHVCEVLCHIAFFFFFFARTLNNLAHHPSFFPSVLFVAKKNGELVGFFFSFFKFFVLFIVHACAHTCSCTHRTPKSGNVEAAIVDIDMAFAQMKSFLLIKKKTK